MSNRTLLVKARKLEKMAKKAKKDAAKEAVNHPDHYGGDTVYEVIKVILAWGLGFCLGNAVKYIARAGKKDPEKTIEDLRKSIWYIEQEITEQEKLLGKD